MSMTPSSADDGCVPSRPTPPDTPAAERPSSPETVNDEAGEAQATLGAEADIETNDIGSQADGSVAENKDGQDEDVDENQPNEHIDDPDEIEVIEELSDEEKDEERKFKPKPFRREDSEDDYDLAYEVSRDLRNVGTGMFKTRRRDAYRRLVQATSYAILLEERVKDLEEKMADLKIPTVKATDSVAGEVFGRRRRYSTGGESVDRPKAPGLDSGAEDEISVPEMSLMPSRMTLDEFENHCDVPKEKLNHFIDLLIELPFAGRPSNQMHLSRTRRRRRKTRSKKSDKTIEIEASKHRVERLRINSSILCEVLEDIMGKDVAPPTGSVILRPFKPFLGYLEELRAHAEKLKAQIKAEEDSKEQSTANTEEAPPAQEEAKEEAVPFSEDTAPSVQPDKTEETTEESTVDQTPPADSMQKEESAEVDGSGDDTKKDEPSDNKSDSSKETSARQRLEHLEALFAVLDKDLKEIMDTHDKYRRRVNMQVTFDNLWHVYAPGDIIYAPKGSQAYQVLSVHDGRQILNPTYDDSGSDRRGNREDDLLADIDDVAKNPFIIDAFHIDFDGELFGPVQYHWTIKPWEGEKFINKLDTFPVAYATPKPISVGKLVNTESMAAASDDMKDTLLARGKRFKKYANAKQIEACDYKGLTAAELPEQVDSAIIIDTSYYYETNKSAIPDIGLLDPTEGDRREILERCLCGRAACELKQCYDDRKVEQDRMDNFITENAGALRTSVEESHDFKDEYLMLLPGQLWGFVLHNRAWHQLDVSKIEPSRKTQAFDDLVLKPEHRRLVESQVTMHSTGVKPLSGSVGQAESDRDHREDLVRGKGKGLIILLHGAPGVGKTSTAECVAEYTKRPLLSITCGDIGDEAIDVQKNLEYNLNLAHRWGCVMLLDEADVFLAARDKRDMKRNAVVSVFLRILEYYSGILFLTTNKIGVIDEAFQSRIHLSLYYPPLDEEQTAKIWEINLRRQKKNKPQLEFEEKDLLRWAQFNWDKCKRTRASPWNGRQIRNACQTVAALAEFDNKGKITVDHLKAVARASSEFDNYLKSVHGGDNAFRAKRVQDRRDDYYEAVVNQNARDDYEEYDEYFRGGYAYDDRDDRDEDYRDHPPPSARLTRRNTDRSRRSMRADHYSPLYDDYDDVPRSSRAEMSDRRPPPPAEFDDPPPARPVVNMGPPPRPAHSREVREALGSRDRWPEDTGVRRQPSRARERSDRDSDRERRR